MLLVDPSEEGPKLGLQVVTIPSLEPQQDAELLVRLLDGVNGSAIRVEPIQARKDSGNGRDGETDTACTAVVVTTDSSSFPTFVLVQSALAVLLPQTVVLPDNAVASLADRDSAVVEVVKMPTILTDHNDPNDKKEPTSIAAMLPSVLLSFPGGGRLLVVSAAVVKNIEGREALGRLLLSLTLQLQNKTDDGTLVAATDTRDISTSGITPNPPTEIVAEAEPLVDLPDFPTLEVGVLGRNNEMQQDFPINSPTPVPIETDLFKGHMLLVMRPENPLDDPFWNEKVFSKRKRRVSVECKDDPLYVHVHSHVVNTEKHSHMDCLSFSLTHTHASLQLIIQIQGKFKRKPNGVVYAGAEVSDQMKLGLVAKG